MSQLFSGKDILCVSNALIHWCLNRNMPKACPYVVMRFAPSLIVAGMNHQGSHRLNKMIICGNLWWFVGGKNLCN